MPELVQNPVPAPEQKEKVKKRNLKKNVAPSEFGGPAKPKSAFFLYGDAKRPAVMQDLKQKAEAAGTSLKVSDVAKTIGDMWKSEPEEVKKPLNEEAKKLKEEYEIAEKAWKETPEYKAFQKEVANHKKKKADKKANDTVKAAGMPKKPLSSWMFFTADFGEKAKAAAPEGAKVDVKQRMLDAKAKWDTMDDAAKAVYVDKAKEAKEKYVREMEAFKQTDAYKSYEAALAKAKKDQKGPSKRKSATSSGPASKRVKNEEAPGSSEKVFDSESEDGAEDEEEGEGDENEEAEE